MLVIDASVFNKLFLDEPDAILARQLFVHALETGEAMAAPDLLPYEALAVALHYGVPFAQVTDLLDKLQAAGFQLSPPTAAMFALAHEIATSGSAKSGHPALYDSVYHAMALELGGTFVTADRRHASKAARFGHVTLLEDWKPAGKD